MRNYPPSTRLRAARIPIQAIIHLLPALPHASCAISPLRVASVASGFPAAQRGTPKVCTPCPAFARLTEGLYTLGDFEPNRCRRPPQPDAFPRSRRSTPFRYSNFQELRAYDLRRIPLLRLSEKS